MRIKINIAAYGIRCGSLGQAIKFEDRPDGYAMFLCRFHGYPKEVWLASTFIEPV